MINHKKLTNNPSILTLSLCTALAACGGGGGGSNNLSNATAPTLVVGTTPLVAVITSPTLATPIIDAKTSKPASEVHHEEKDVSCGLGSASDFRTEILYRVNNFRAVGAVCGSTIHRATAPLNWNDLLQRAASSHSSDMASNNFFSHVSADGRSLPMRYAEVGYGFSTAGENIAMGQSTVEEVIRSWINSPGHCKNLMNPTYQDVAVVCKRNDTTSHGLYWTMNLGRQ